MAMAMRTPKPRSTNVINSDIDLNISPKEFIHNGNFFEKYSDFKQIKSILKDYELTINEALKLLGQLHLLKETKHYKFKVFKILRINFNNKLVNMIELISKAYEVLGLSVLSTIEKFLKDLKDNKCNANAGLTEEQQKEVVKILGQIYSKIAEIEATNKKLENLRNQRNTLVKEREDIEMQINEVENDMNSFMSNRNLNDFNGEFEGIDLAIYNEKRRITETKRRVQENYAAINDKKKNLYKLVLHVISDKSESDELLLDSRSDSGPIHLTKFGFHLLCFLISIGGMTLSGTMVSASPYEFTKVSNILYYVLPMMLAGIPPLLHILLMYIFHPDEDSIFFISDKRILISIINLIFVLLTIGLHFSPKIVPLCIIIRSFQGLAVGTMSFVYPIALKQVATSKRFRTYLIVYFCFFALGIFLFRTIGAHWIKIICIIPFLQSLLIWLSTDDHYRDINLSIDEFFYSKNLIIRPVEVIARYAVQAFVGSFAFWIGINRYNYNYFSVFKFTITFISTIIAFSIIFKFLTAKIEFHTFFYYIVSFILYFVGCGIGLGHKESIGLYLIVAASGSGLFMFCWDHFIIQNGNKASTMPFSWFLFWILNGFSAILYLMTTPFIWFIVGASAIGIYILYLIIKLLASKDDIGLVATNKFIRLVIYSLSALSIGSSMIGKCKLTNTWDVTLYNAVPLFAAVFASIVIIISKIRMKNYAVFIFENRELEIAIFNIIFIISTGIVGYIDSPIVVLVFRSIEGLSVGFLTIISSIMVAEIELIYFNIYLGFFAIGLTIGNCILEKWVIFSLITSSLQLFLIWICKPEKYTYRFEFSKELFIGGNMEYVTPILHTVNAFAGVIGMFIYNSRISQTYLQAFYYDLAFCVAAIFSIIIFYLLYAQNDTPLVLLYHYFSLVTLLIGHILYYVKVKAGLYVIGAGIGLGAFGVPWFKFVSKSYSVCAFIFAWGCFWLANGCAIFLYLLTGIGTWTLIGYVLTGTAVFGALAAGYIILTKKLQKRCGVCENIYIWDTLLGLGGILIGTIIAPGPLDKKSGPVFDDEKWAVFSSYPPLFAFVGAFATFFIISVVKQDLKIIFSIMNLAYCLFTSLMNIGKTPMIVFKYFQSIIIGSLSVLIPIMIYMTSKYDFFHAFNFYLLMIPVGMLIVSYAGTIYLMFIYILPILYLLLIWLSTNWEYKFEDPKLKVSVFELGLAVTAPFLRGYCCNSLWIYHHSGIGRFISMIQAIIAAVFQSIVGISRGYHCHNGTILLKILVICTGLAGSILALIYIEFPEDRVSAIVPMAAAYSFGLYQIPYLRCANVGNAEIIVIFTICNWFSSSISCIMWYYIPRITSYIVLAGYLSGMIAKFVKWFCNDKIKDIIII